MYADVARNTPVLMARRRNSESQLENDSSQNAEIKIALFKFPIIYELQATSVDSMARL